MQDSFVNFWIKCVKKDNNQGLEDWEPNMQPSELPVSL